MMRVGARVCVHVIEFPIMKILNNLWKTSWKTTTLSSKRMIQTISSSYFIAIESARTNQSSNCKKLIYSFKLFNTPKLLLQIIILYIHFNFNFNWTKSLLFMNTYARVICVLFCILITSHVHPSHNSNIFNIFNNRFWCDDFLPWE